MKDYLKNVAAQSTAILLAASAAGLIAFFQTVGQQTGICEPVGSNPGEVGLLGGLFKAMHSSFVAMRANMLT